MLKSFDIRVQSRFSANYYDSFVVDAYNNRVTFNQCDARRNGQVARLFVIKFDTVDGSADIYAESAEGSRKEVFSRTQCLKLALRLLQEVKAEMRQAESVRSVATNKVSKPHPNTVFLGVVFGLLTLMIVYFGVTLGPDEYLTATRVFLGVVCGLLTVGCFHNAYLEMTGKADE